MSSVEVQAIFQRIDAASKAAGLDLVHAFDVGRYNAVAQPLDALDDFGTGSRLGILIGNTRRLWPAFISAVENDAALRESQNPLDDYVTAQLTCSVTGATPERHRIVFAHETKPRAFPIQRLAELVGFAAVSPSQLAIHPLHGLWFALRAVVVIDCPGPETALPEPERPCSGCSAPCVTAFERAIAASGSPLTSAAIAVHAAEWIAVRDACPVGKGSRYGEAQLAYHYATARSVAGSRTT